MRKIWTRALAVGLMSMVTLACAGVWAQQEPTAPSNPANEGAPGGRGAAGIVQNRMERLSKELNLTEEQQEKIRPILKHEVERIREVRSNTSLTQGEARRRIARIRRNSNQQIAQFLTPEQKKQLQEMREAHRDGGGSAGGQHGPGGGGGSNGPPAPQNPDNPNL